MGKRVLLLILDGFGIGECHDSAEFGDSGANTCQHILKQNPDISLPTLQKLGLLDAFPYNQMMEINPNKDTLSGISEMMGSLLPKLDTFSDGIPLELIQKIESSIGVRVINGGVGSGTVIMKKWGLEHLRTGFPILYTSQDSVLQLLAHEEVVTPSLLYYYCQVIRDLVDPLYTIGRVIARPFTGISADTFLRTNRRKDFVYKTQKNPFLTTLAKQHIEIFGNKIIRNIFGESLIRPVSGETNEELYCFLEKEFKETTVDKNVLYIIDLEDFDMLYGHRRDPIGYGHALKKLDQFLGTFLMYLLSEDLVIMTADHGNDPTFSLHTDHTRELVPLVVFNNSDEVKPYGHLEGFFHISNIIKSYFDAGVS
jgi:phosphopentomutase